MAPGREISLDEQTCRALLDQSLTGIFILIEERIRWANRTMVELLGFSAEELAAQNAWAFIHPEDRDRVRTIARERIAGVRESEVYETRLLRKDGTSIWAEIRATPITLKDGPAVLTNLVDITDRKQAEYALAESEQRFRTFFENAPIGIYRIAPDGRVLLANPTLLRMLGYEETGDLQAHGLNRDAFEPTFPRSEFQETIDRDGRVQGLESAWIRKDDSLLYVREHALAVHSADGQVLYYEGTVEDVTRQKQSSQAMAQLRIQLADEQGRLKALVEHLPEGVMLLDADHRVVLANPPAIEYLAALSPAGPGQVPERLSCVALAARIQERDFEITSQGEPARVFEVACRPVRSDSAASGHAIVLREVTEERDLQKQLRQQERQAAIGTLAAGVAHDFNNLISAIEGSAWILLRKLAADSPLRRPADNIRATCDRASALTRRLLDFGRSRCEEPRKVSLNGVVDEMGKMLRGLLGSNIELRTRLALDLDPVLADHVQLEQVIVNLVINARDAMRLGGELTIETDNLHLAEPDLDWPGEPEPGDYVLLRVTDTGEGMDGPTLERIFEPFFTTREDSGGMGMGLSTVKTIVAQSSGHIRVSSSPGQGATFEILLPRTG